MKVDSITDILKQLLKAQVVGVLFLLASVGSGCRSDRPLEFDLLTDPNDRGRVDSTVVANLIQETSFGDTLTATGVSPFLELGQLDNTSTRVLLRFRSVPDSITISKATLILDTNTIYSTGENRSVFPATVHRVREDWVERSVTGENFGNSFDASPLSEATILSIGADFSESDSLFIESIRFEFDDTGLQLVRGWVDTTRGDNFGIIIQHGAGSDFIKEFLSRNGLVNQPRLELESLTSSGVDTTISVATEDATIVTRTGGVPAEPLFIDDLQSLQTVLNFDLSSIPRESSINDATLELTIDRDESRIKVSGYVFQIDRLAEAFAGPGALQVDSDLGAISQIVNNTTTTLSIPVPGLVQFWISENVPNHGMLLRTSNPGRDASKLVFRSNATDPTLGPRLIIHFSSAPTAQ